MQTNNNARELVLYEVILFLARNSVGGKIANEQPFHTYKKLCARAARQEFLMRLPEEEDDDTELSGLKDLTKKALEHAYELREEHTYWMEFVSISSKTP